MLERLARLPLRVVRRLRWGIGAWSKASDVLYHDRIYRRVDYDPFQPDYPGYATIRRFADHVEPLVPKQGIVLDIGCGTGEITCELARRHPHLTFLGIDHSEQAIERARDNVSRLGLRNASFERGDAEGQPAECRYDLVTMFDAFHHLEHPAPFLMWLKAHTSRCVFIEPAGTRTGRWARDMDVDWLLLDLGSIRDRLESVCHESARPAVDADEPDTSEPRVVRGEGAVERRYSLDDFDDFFRGWNVRVTGTIAGFDRYPSTPRAQSPIRRAVGLATYDLVKATEEALVRNGRDGGAKHWVIAATSDVGVIEPRRPPMPIQTEPDDERLASAFDVRYVMYDGPVQVRSGSEFRAAIEFANDGWDEWRSDGPNPVRVSYHWLDGRGADVVELDGVRSDLTRPVGPGDTCRVLMRVVAPARPGTYCLAVDLVKEGVAWFSDAGVPWHKVRVKVHR